MIKWKIPICSIILLIGLVVCGLFLFAPYLPGIFADYKASRALEIYPGSEKIFEAVGNSAPSNTDVKLQFYWSEASIDVVRTYYEEMGYKFMLGQDKRGEWLITGFDRHNKSVQTSENSGSTIVHSSFCLNTDEPIHSKPKLDCYTLALIDAHQPKIYDLTVSLPSSLRFSTPPSELSTIPSHGTVIIFTYYRENIW